MTTVTAQIPLHEHVQSFVRTPRKLLIGGRWREAASGKTFATYNPATGDMLAHVAEGGVIGGKCFSRRSVVPSTADQHLARCTDKGLNVFVYRDLCSDGSHECPPFSIPALRMRYRGVGRLQPHYIGCPPGIIERQVIQKPHRISGGNHGDGKKSFLVHSLHYGERNSMGC